jgi:hypothetical protein
LHRQRGDDRVGRPVRDALRLSGLSGVRRFCAHGRRVTVSSESPLERSLEPGAWPAASRGYPSEVVRWRARRGCSHDQGHSLHEVRLLPLRRRS